MYPDFYVVTEITKKSDEDINKFVLMLGKGVLRSLTPAQLAWQTASKNTKEKSESLLILICRWFLKKVLEVKVDSFPISF